MSTSPLVSFVLPVYNDECHISAAISSVLRQTLDDFELLIINDGSTDGTLEHLLQFDDRRIHIINQTKMGFSAAVNRGLNQASGVYIARMDSDDTCTPDRLSLQVDFLNRNPDHALVGSSCVIVDEAANPLVTMHAPQTDAEIRRAMLWHNPIVHSSVLIRKQILDEVGPYSERYSRIGHDYELWWRILGRSRAANLPSTLVTRMHRSASAFRLPKSLHHKVMRDIKIEAYRARCAPLRILPCAALNHALAIIYTISETLERSYHPRTSPPPRPTKLVI